MGSTEKDKEIFNEALERPADQRVAYLRKVCRGDQSTFDRIQDLLAAYEDADGILDPDIFDGEKIGAVKVCGESPGTIIGRYKLLEQIGEGGFGIVYMAEQQKPFHRKVALKIIKLGMDTKQVIARFETEREAMAMMEHPNIAKILDAGATDSGRPYFVMELVKGTPINEYCDENHLSIRARLELIIPVGQVLQHAHQKGIIHRDIKPSNVLVTMQDGIPRPMVIDFGIAKAINHRLTRKTLFTEFAQLIGTPAYMSPEQAENSASEIDIRTDIYSLGVLLYELLTGGTPFSERQLRRAGYAEMQRIIAEKEPDKPSTRISSVQNEQRSVLAKNRSMEVGSFVKTLKGDLDRIVMKALEKDRTCRYATAGHLVLDIQRHMRNEPVSAAPPSAFYKLRKCIRRHRIAVAVGFAFMVIIASSLGIIKWQMDLTERANREIEREATLHASEREVQLEYVYRSGLITTNRLREVVPKWPDYAGFDDTSKNKSMYDMHGNVLKRHSDKTGFLVAYPFDPGVPHTISYENEALRIQANQGHRHCVIAPQEPVVDFEDFTAYLDILKWNADAHGKGFPEIGIAAGTFDRTNPVANHGIFGGFVLTRLSGSQSLKISTSSNELHYSDSFPITPGDRYRLIFSKSGNQLSLDLFNVSDMSPVVDTFRITDNSFSHGEVVIFKHGLGTQAYDVTVDNFFVTGTTPSL